jgi:predicted amidohydrolase
MKHSTIILTLILNAVFFNSAFAVGEFKITADDAAEFDRFGYSVSINGNYAIVGAVLDDDDGRESGSAYIFVRDGVEWTQQQKLTADDAANEDWFGCSVSISSDYAIVGAYYGNDDDGGNSGSAYIFVRDGEEWTQQQKLTANDAAEWDRFGISVSIDGDYAIVGANLDDDDGEHSGSAYIFIRDGEEWTQQQKLTASDADEYNYFGYSVSISGDYAIVGADGDSDDGHQSGSAYIFIRDGEEWTEQQKLTADDAAEGDWFGISVSIDGNYAIVGAWGNDDDGDRSGSAYIFVRDGEEWTQQQKLTADDAAAGDDFGRSVSISGDYAIVGAFGNTDDGQASGSAYILVRDGDEWTHQQKLTADDAAEYDEFGVSVSISSDYAIVGAEGNDDDGERSGSAYVYTLNPDIVVLAEALNFETMWVNESEDLILPIVNEGIHDLIVSDITVADDYFSTNFDDEAIIKMGDTLIVVVTFAPEETGEFNGTLTITSNDPDEEEVTVELHGIGDTEVKFTRIEFYENVEAIDSNPNNLIESGRNVCFKVRVVNELDRNIRMGHGMLESHTQGVEVVIESVAFNNIPPDEAEWSVHEFEVAIADDFEPGGYASFSLTMEDEVDPERTWISNFSFPIAPLLMTGRILMDDDDNPDSDGDNDDIAEPGEIIEVIPLINNASPDAWHQVSGQLRFAGDGDFITVWDDVEGATGIVLDTWRYNFIAHQQQPIQPDNENIQPEEDFVFEYSEGARWASELPFDLVISGYYNEAAGDAWDEGGVLMKWSSRFIINEGLSVPNNEKELPTEFSLSYPNPFNAVTQLSFDLPLAANVSIQVFDLKGQLVSTLVNGKKSTGSYIVTWNGQDAPAGIYLVRMEADAFSAVRKVVLVK